MLSRRPGSRTRRFAIWAGLSVYEIGHFATEAGVASPVYLLIGMPSYSTELS